MTTRWILGPLLALLLLASCGDDTDVTTTPPAELPPATDVPADPAGDEAPPVAAEPDPRCSGAEAVTAGVVPADVPEATAATLVAIRSAAQHCDFDQLAWLALADGTFNASFGQDATDPAALANFWRDEEAGQELTAVLVQLTTMATSSVDTTGPDGEPLTLHVAPRALHEADDEAARQEVLDAFGDDAEGWFVDGQYLGWRLGVTGDGHWWFFVAGD